MELVLPGLYATDPQPLPFATSSVVRAFRLERPAGDLVVYGADTLGGLDGIAGRYLNHWHEAMFAGDAAPTFVHEDDRAMAAAPASSGCARSSSTFSSRGRRAPGSRSTRRRAPRTRGAGSTRSSPACARARIADRSQLRRYCAGSFFGARWGRTSRGAGVGAGIRRWGLRLGCGRRGMVAPS